MTKNCVDCGTKKSRWGERCKSCATKIRWTDPDFRADTIEKMKHSNSRPEERHRRSEASKATWGNSNHRVKIMNAMRQAILAGKFDEYGYVWPYEQIVADALDVLEIGYVHQFRLGAYFYDLMLPDYATIIEVDGSDHIRQPSVRKRDRVKTALANKNGYDVWRLTNQQAESDGLMTLLESELKCP